MGLIQNIAAIPMFEDLPREHLEDLATIVMEQVFQRGQMIFSEGDEANGFYVGVTGRIKIFKMSPEGKEQTLHLFGPGEPFGEVPVFTGQQFPANAQAMEKTRAYFFPRDAFVRLIKKNPSLALNMLAILSIRLRRFARLVEDLSLKEVPGRLAAYLLYLSEQGDGAMDLELTITKGQLASLLGTIPETLSRILGRMGAQGLIRSEGPRITILDSRGLEELAEGGHL